jgi:tRNA(Arg) A34 adenosine deaminase TadA
MALDATVGATHKPCQLCGAPVEWLGNRKYCFTCLQRTCEQCGVIFPIRQVTKKPKFCSIACYNVAKIGREPSNKGMARIPDKVCEQCKETFHTYKKAMRFCSTVCAGLGQRGDKSPNYRGAVKREHDSVEYKAFSCFMPRWWKVPLVRLRRN